MGKPLRVLIVEDSGYDAELLLRELRHGGYEPTFERVDTPETMNTALDRQAWDIVLADHAMPHFNSLAALELLQKRGLDLPFIIVSGVMGVDTAVAAMKAGAHDYVMKDKLALLVPAVEHGLCEAKVRREHKLAQEAHLESEEKFRSISASAQDAIIMVDNAGNISYWNEAARKTFGYSQKEVVGKFLHELIVPDGLRGDFLKGFRRFQDTGQGPFIGKTVELVAIKRDGTEFPVEHSVSAVRIKGKWNAVGIMRDITERKQAEEEIKQSIERLRKALGGTVQALALTVETRDPYTSGHQQRVADLARVIAAEMGLSREQIDGIRVAGRIHDIGKIAVPAEILSKPGSLTETEYNIIKTHPQVGYDILKEVEFPWPVAQIVLQHQERINGSGYPLGLSDDEILLEARILGVADVVEAMSSHRPYRPALGIGKALEEISKNRGVLYDSKVVDICVRLFTEKGFEFKKFHRAGRAN
ncbi:MAG: HD domain-containing phosphohydrolase [Candidatus Brocadiales bacterium]